MESIKDKIIGRQISEIASLREAVKMLNAKVQLLIDNMPLESGEFTFPDGETWQQGLCLSTNKGYNTPANTGTTKGA